MALWYFIFILQILQCCSETGSLSVTTQDEGLIVQYLQQSYKQCTDKCDANIKCVSAKYFRNFKLCILYAVPKHRDVGFSVYSKPERLLQEHSDIIGVCDIDNDSACTHMSCPLPPSIFGADISGNKLQIGSLIKYTCRITGDSQTSSCSSTGVWTSVTLSCTGRCETSATFDYKIVNNNETHIFTEQSCPDGTTVVKYNSIQVCDLLSGDWYISGHECCETEGNSGWEVVFKYSKGSALGVYKMWKSDKGLPDPPNPDFYRSSVIDNWNNSNIIRVKLDVLKDNNVVGYLLFDACGSDMYDWFSAERLVGSSWQDLQPGLSVGEMSIAGSVGGFRRFYVSNAINADCISETGWFVTVASFYTCSDSIDFTKRILYSTGTVAMPFHTMGEADHFVISIQTGN